MSRRAGQAQRAVGLVQLPGGQGLLAAALEGDGAAIAGFGRVARRLWSVEERQAMAQPGAAGADARRELSLSALAEVLAGFPEAEVLGCDSLHPEVGAALAEVLDLPVVSDFADADRELGGQGGAMDAFFHHALWRWLGETAPAAVLVLEPTCRLVWVDPRIADPAAPGAVLAFDIGPGLPETARRQAPGAVSEPLFAHASAERWFLTPPPKRLNARDFPDLDSGLAALSPADAGATARALVTFAAMVAVEHCPAPPDRLLVLGPDRDDADLAGRLARGLERSLVFAEDLGLDGDAIAALACGWLALRVVRGLPTSAPGSTGVAAPVGGGRVSRPTAAPTRS